MAISGGIGAGKSTVGEYLASRGWLVLDADESARRVVAPGKAAWRALRDAFGRAILRDDDTLDRAFLAEIIFRDASARRRVNSITHPQIEKDLVAELNGATGDVVFVALPLFRREHRTVFALDEVWAILASEEVSLERLRRDRNYSDDEARVRIAAQISNDERARLADNVIWNEGTRDELFAKVDQLVGSKGVS